MATSPKSAKSKAAKKKSKKTCKRVRIKGTKRYKKVCTTKKKKVVKKKKATTPAATTAPILLFPKKPSGGQAVPTPSPAAPPVTTPPNPIPTPPEDPPPATGVPVYSGTFGLRQAQRLLWRAGFGPKPGQAEAMANQGLVQAVRSLTRPSGTASLVGNAPVVDGAPLAPADAWGHDHMWWLDRMIRSDQPLVERMTLIWHDWFATSNRDVGNAQMMLDQNDLFRRRALGSFRDLAMDITVDHAMLVFLSGLENRRGAPNENYAREYLELFTLGADRGAYTEADVRSLARAFTGWRADWSDQLGLHNFRFDSNRYDNTSKTLWAGTAHERSGNFNWQQAVDLGLENPYHRSFFVLKLWSYFIPSPPSAATQAALEELYVSSQRNIGQVVEAILLHPDLYTGAPMVKPPVVFNAGLMRALGQTITDGSWSWRGSDSGQQLFYPPNVSGWNDRAWLDTSTLYGRWYIVQHCLQPLVRTNTHYNNVTETPEQAVATAIATVGNPPLTTETYNTLLTFASPASEPGFSAAEYKAQRQNALRQLIASSPDCQVS